jgi:hypothetical protein
MDTSIDDQSDALKTSESSELLSPPERKEIVRQYNWIRKHRKGHGQIVAPSRSSRPHIMISGIEKELFFDTTVEIVKIWDHARPVEMYVTDYTSHPLLYGANDVHLGVQSREELLEQQEESNDAGNGRVLPISLWDEQEENIRLVSVGMLVHLENVRGKVQPNNYLCGTLGGGWRCPDDKLRVILVRDTKVIEEFKRRKEEYMEDLALKSVERLDALKKLSRSHQMQETENRDTEEQQSPGLDEDPSARSTAEVPSFRSVPSDMPPPGQKAPLSVIENQLDQHPSSFTDSETNSSGKQPSQEEFGPALIEHSFASHALTTIEQVRDLSADELARGDTYVCIGIVRDVIPKRIEEFVRVSCGLCQSR